MKKFKQNKGGTMAIILITIAVIGLIAWISFSNTTDVASVDALITEQEDISASERIIIENLAKLQSIDLNTGVFANPAFGQLIDFSRPIIEEPAGRVNPFDNINLDEINNAGAENTTNDTTSNSSGAESQNAQGTESALGDINIDDLNGLDNLAF